MSYEDIFADMLQTERIEVTRVAIEFLLTHPTPCVGDLDRLKRENKAAFDEVGELLAKTPKEPNVRFR